MSVDVRKLAREVLKLLPKLIEEDKQLAYELYTALQRYFVPRDLFERVMRLLEEMRSDLKSLRGEVREHGRKLDEHGKILREHSRILEEHSRMLGEHGRKLNWLISAVQEIRQTLGVRFEKVARSITEKHLKDLGILPKDAKLEAKTFRVNGRAIEINIFCEEPLILGEVTAVLRSLDKLEKMVEKFRLVERVLGKRPRLKVVYVGGISSDIYQRAREIAEREGIELIVGEVIEI